MTTTSVRRRAVRKKAVAPVNLHDASAAVHLETESLPAHVLLCATRFESVTHRLERLEKIILLTNSSIFAALVSLLVALLQKN